MQSLIKSLIIAFSMYSKVPMPNLKMNDKDMRYVMGFFPVVGLFLGASVFVWWHIVSYFAVPSVSMALIIMILPVLITGGIHIDGYMDTCDAIHSYADREKKLTILKDSHIGAFAVIMLFVYFAVSFAAIFCIVENGNDTIFAVFGFIFYLSRIMSGFAAVNFRGAGNNGILHTFTNAADKKCVNVMLCIQCILCIAGMSFFNVFWAGILLSAELLILLYYRHMAYKEFGGVTGDLAGYFLCMSELLLTVVLACCITV